MRAGAGGKSLSLTGSVALGTGVMIGAGIFALIGQVAEFAGSAVPWAFLAAAVVVAFSSYSYIRYSSTNPSSGGIAMLLKAAYGPGVVAGTFSLFMYVSMVLAEGLLARTFGTYLLRPFDMQGSAVWVAALAVAAIVAAATVNLVGNTVVESAATVTAVVKLVGIAVMAVAGIAATGISALPRSLSGNDQPSSSHGWWGFLAGVALCILAYKGFTTITNQGDDIRDPQRNIARSIVIAIGVCTLIYLLLAVAVAGSLSVPEILRARDYALAEAAAPLFGPAGVWLTVGIAIVATVSGLVASLFAVSRLYDMLRDMGQVPGLPDSVTRQSLLITSALAIGTATAFDLGRIAALGAMLYLSMDIAIHWGMIRHLRCDVDIKLWVPAGAIALDLLVLVPFVVMVFRTNPTTLAITVAVAVVIALAQWITVRHRTPARG